MLYEFVGYRRDINSTFYINGVNISNKTWYLTGKCVTVKDLNGEDYYFASEYYLKLDSANRLYFAVAKTNENKEAIYVKIKDGVN